MFSILGIMALLVVGAIVGMIRFRNQTYFDHPVPQPVEAREDNVVYLNHHHREERA